MPSPQLQGEPAATKGKIDRRTGFLAVAIGLIATAAGLTVGDFTRSSFAAVLINIGTAMGLLLVILWFERRLVKRVEQVAEATASETVERETADLRDRVVRLENLDEAQTAERERRRGAASEPVRAMREAPLSSQVVGRVLADADDRNLFGPEFCVRTSAEPDCHLLYFLPLRDPAGTPMLWLDFEPFELGEPMEVDGEIVPTARRGETTVMWVNDEDAAEIAGELEAGLERSNRTLNGFRLRYALDQLDACVTIADKSRAADAGDPHRLRGDLEVLINNEWAITTYGLEQVAGPAALKVADAGWVGSGGASVFHHTQLKELLPAGQERPTGYEEAVEWVTGQRGWLRPDDPQGLARLGPGRDRTPPA